MAKKIWLTVLLALLIAGAFFGGYFWQNWKNSKQRENEAEYEIGSNLEADIDGNYERDASLPLNKWTIPAMRETEVIPGKITLESVVSDEDDYTSLIFSFETEGKKMSGLLNWPKGDQEIESQGTILMLRGYAPQAGYQSGTGSRNSSINLAKRGFQTWAPDFLGYGESDPGPADDWQGRFEKPLQMKQFLANLKNNQYECNQENLDELTKKNKLNDEEKKFMSLCESGINNLSNEGYQLKTEVGKIGIWAHSNGGQIALTTLEITDEALPTVLWAPVSVGFPYSVLFFTDEYEDEGKGMRKYIGMLEEDYDVFDFTHTQHWDKLPGGVKIQLHHGTADDAAIIAWSDEFEDKIEAENKRREKELKVLKSAASDLNAEEKEAQEKRLEPIELEYFRYSGADHNLRPSWDEVMMRTAAFFEAEI